MGHIVKLGHEPPILKMQTEIQTKRQHIFRLGSEIVP